jgi:hypothetical protein
LRRIYEWPWKEVELANRGGTVVEKKGRDLGPKFLRGKITGVQNYENYIAYAHFPKFGDSRRDACNRLQL